MIESIAIKCFCWPLIQSDIANECFASDDRLTLYRLSNAVPACCTPIHDSQKPTDTENRAIGIRTQCWKETLELEERKLEFDAMIDRTACFFYHYSVQSVARKNFDSSFSKFDHLVTAHYICFSIQPILLANHQNTRQTDFEWSVENSPEIGRGEHNQHEQDVRAEHDRTTWI